MITGHIHMGLRDFAEFGLDRSVPMWLQPMPGHILDLGPGNKTIEPTSSVTRCDWPEYNFEDADCLGEWRDNSVGGIFAVNVLEHLHDPRPLIKECGRVLKLHAPMNIFVPHARSGMYLQDLDHKTSFILDTWNNLLGDHPYYEKGHGGYRLEVGANFLFGVKEENLAVVTQLIKVGE